MTEEIPVAKTLQEAKEEVRTTYADKSTEFKEISKEEYEAIEKDEREDSNNHTKLEKLGEEADVIDLAYYKYLPERQVAYRIVLRHKTGEEDEDYFILIPNLA